MRYLIAFLFTGIFSAAAQTNEFESAPPLLLPPKIEADNMIYALVIVFAFVFLLTIYVGVLYFRERRRIKTAPASAPQENLALAMTVSALKPESLSITEWKDRALSAEALANNQAMLLRERLMPELTEFVKQSLVQGLASQRDALLAMQQQAMQSLIEMETRLAALQTPLQERIRTYENRITELEKEILAQGAEMRELTRTILELMRKKLEEERAQSGVSETFN